MISWISEKQTVTYIENIKQIDQTKRTCLFATAFHLINECDKSGPHPLAQGSLIVETGGTKGKSRQLDRDPYLRLIAENFDLSREQILSEYGMSEIASQAYEQRTKEGYRYQWPSNVETAVLSNDMHLSQNGVGALAILDKSRLDFPQWLLTDDIVDLHEHSFRLIRRARSQPLKGCSLLAEDLAANDLTLGNRLQNKSTSDVDRTADLKANLAKSVQSYLLSTEARDDITADIGNTYLGALALEELRDNFENLKVDDVVTRSQISPNKHYLLILPSTHFMAGLQHIFLCAATGAQLTIRIPAALKHSRFHNRFLRLLSKQKNFTLVDEGFFINANVSKHFDTIIVFGENQTAQYLQSTSGCDIIAFGTRTTGYVISNWYDVSPLAVFKDVFNLFQRGCRSPRFALAQSMPPDKWTQDFENILMEKIPEANTPDETLAYFVDRQRLNERGHKTTLIGTKFLFSELAFKRCHLKYDLAQTVPSLCILNCPSAIDEENRGVYGYNCPDLLDKSTLPAHTFNIGNAHYQRFDGLYDGKPLFQSGFRY